MGLRDAVKQGGGFWNNVDGVLKAVRFTTVPPGADAEPGEWMYMVPEIHIDGAEKATTQHLFMGAAERYEIAEDGAEEISGANGANFTVGANTPAGRFITSLLEANPEFDVEAALPDVTTGEALTFAPVYGMRLRLKQEVDVEGTKKNGKRKVTVNGQKKEYDRTNTIVATVYSLGGGKSSSKGTGKPAAAAAGKKAAPKQDNALRDKADEAVKDLCEAAVDKKKNPSGAIPTTKLSVGVLKILSGDKDKEAVRKLVQTEDYLTDAAERGVIAFDSDEGTVALVDSAD